MEKVTARTPNLQKNSQQKFFSSNFVLIATQLSLSAVIVNIP